MMHLPNALIGIGSGLLLVACATTPNSPQSTGPLAASLPAYSETVHSLALAQVQSAGCPVDRKWENLEWKKILPLANACAKSKDWHQLEKLGNFLAKKAYLTPWGGYYLSLAAEARKDFPRALWMLELALKKDPKEGMFHYQLGRLHWEMKEDALALKELKLASDLNPTLTEAHFVLGQISTGKQEISKAESYLQKALASNPQHVPSLLALASLKMNAKDWIRAEEYLHQAISLNGRSAKTRLALAQVQEEHLKKIQDALQGYRLLKQMAAKNELDETVHVNLEEKIETLEKSLAQGKSNQVTVRQPSTVEKVR